MYSYVDPFIGTATRDFGFRITHGCVNLSLADARWLFDWTSPLVPEGWHTVTPTRSMLPTAVLIEPRIAATDRLPLAPREPPSPAAPLARP